MCNYVFKGYTPAQLGSHPLALDCNPLGFPANTQAHQRSGSHGRWIRSILMTLQLPHILVMSIVLKSSTL